MKNETFYLPALRAVPHAQEGDIKDGVLMLREEVDDVHKQNEITARDKEAGYYDKRLVARYFREVQQTLRHLGNLEGKVIVEYGCGTGRFTTELLERGATVLAVDFSLASLRVLQRKLPSDAKIGLVCADASRLRTADDFFDGAFAAQFFEHIPSDADRKRFLAHVAHTLKPGGLFVATIYHHDIRRRIQRLPQVGVHKNGVYYRFSTAREIRSLWSESFRIQNLRFIDVVLPLTQRLKVPERIQGIISSLLERVPGLQLFGHLICITATSKK